MSELATPDYTVAAVDLGSNSFHLIVARLDNGRLNVIDRLREPVRLGAGLTPTKQLDDDARQRAVDCLSRFGQRLADLPGSRVRAVGTNTMRQVRDGGRFIREAEAALGHSIDIIAGREEARLIYQGVAHGLAAGEEARLVVDIGGGSTELIRGRGMQPEERESLFMGCVSMSRWFFPNGEITEAGMNAAITRGRVQIRPVKHLFSQDNWDVAIGSSGTIKSIRSLVRAAGWSDQGITRSSLKKLRKALISAGHVDKVELEGLSVDRRPVLAGGVAVLSAVFKALDIEVMQVSDLALREGLVYEMLGLVEHRDVRDHTVQAMAQRFGLDQAQAERVSSCATDLLQQVSDNWDFGQLEADRMLDWAARLHEIGLVISHSSFHKHGWYILANADLPGFSRQQQAVLAALVRGHRRKFPQAVFDELPDLAMICTRRLCVLLRLAVLLHRGHSRSQKPDVVFKAEDEQLRLEFPAGWLDEHPLTQTELTEEAELLGAAGFQFEFE